MRLVGTGDGEATKDSLLVVDVIGGVVDALEESVAMLVDRGAVGPLESVVDVVKEELDDPVLLLGDCPGPSWTFCTQRAETVMANRKRCSR